MSPSSSRSPSPTCATSPESTTLTGTTPKRSSRAATRWDTSHPSNLARHVAKRAPAARKSERIRLWPGLSHHRRLVFLAGPHDHTPGTAEVLTNHPPLCARHVNTAARLCPHLDGNTTVYLAQSAPLHGATGTLQGLGTHGVQPPLPSPERPCPTDIPAELLPRLPRKPARPVPGLSDRPPGAEALAPAAGHPSRAGPPTDRTARRLLSPQPGDEAVE